MREGMVGGIDSGTAFLEGWGGDLATPTAPRTSRTPAEVPAYER